MFDYVIVGAGSSGCVLANQLSEDPGTSVLLIEAGPVDASPFIPIPRGYAKLMVDPRHAWIYPVRRGGGHNEPEFHIRGRTLGGSSAINGLLYMRGQSTDFDDWGLPGWGWKEFLGAFRAIENHELGPDDGRGGSGPLRVSAAPYRLPLADAVVAAANELGAPVRSDLNAQDGEGVGYSARNIWRGRRQSAAQAFLRPVRGRRNLSVVTETDISRVEMSGGRASGVSGRNAAGPVSYSARKAVVLCAGAIHTPKLLQLSGIGPAALLKRHGVEVVVDAPEVGQNVSDHRCLFLKFRVARGSENHEFSGWRLYRNLLRQQLLGQGPLSRPAFEVGGYVRSDPALGEPDVRLLANIVTIDAAGGHRMKLEDHPGLTLGGCQMRPISRGSVAIASADPAATPEIVTGALTDEADRLTAVRLFKYVRRLAAAPSLAAFGAVETSPGTSIERDEEILDYWARFGSSGMHITGSCRMGEDPGSVVDTDLQVRGARGLFVADISVLPSVVSGNTNAVAMALGRLAAPRIRLTVDQAGGSRA